MPAQGIALGIGSGVENSNALKEQNRLVVKNLVSPFQGWADSHSDRIPRADPASGVPPARAFLFRPLRGGRKAQHQNSQGGKNGDPPFARGGKRRNEIGMKAQLVQDQLFTSPVQWWKQGAASAE